VQTLTPAQGNVAYATVLSQTLQSLLETYQIYLGRVTCLILITVVAILPLCLMKEIDHLSPFSALGVAGMGVLVVSMLVRLFDGSYQPGGTFFEDIEEEDQPGFGEQDHKWSPLILPYLCMIFQR
jgi:amino acid permease